MTIIQVSPHPAQRTVHSDLARFKVLSAGRRFGKTRLGVNECLDRASKGGYAWWVSPSYKTSEVGWRPIRRISRYIPGAQISLADRTVVFPGGGLVAIRSADNPDSLRGEGLDYVVMDEAAYMKKEAWSEAIRPALSDKKGGALFISTPNGRNWFWDVFQKGIYQEDGWASFQFPTAANPFIDPEEIEAARHDLPEIIFRQEYLAEFIDDSGGVFRRVQEAIKAERLDDPEYIIDPNDPEKRTIRQYAAGVDVAAVYDYTVVSIMDVEQKRLVYQDRFNRVDYNILEDRLEAIYRRFGVSVMVIESNSIGQGVIDHLYKRRMNIIPFTTTNATKQVVVSDLQSAFEHGEITIYNNPVLVGELLSFQAVRNPSGSFSYGAPEGMHDDTVMSLALAWSCVKQNRNVILFEA